MGLFVCLTSVYDLCNLGRDHQTIKCRSTAILMTRVKSSGSTWTSAFFFQTQRYSVLEQNLYFLSTLFTFSGRGGKFSTSWIYVSHTLIRLMFLFSSLSLFKEQTGAGATPGPHKVAVDVHPTGRGWNALLIHRCMCEISAELSWSNTLATKWASSVTLGRAVCQDLNLWFQRV